MIWGEKVAIFNWAWDRNSAPREGQKMPWPIQLVSSEASCSGPKLFTISDLDDCKLICTEHLFAQICR